MSMSEVKLSPPRWNVKSSNFLPIRRLNAYSQAKVAAALGAHLREHVIFDLGAMTTAFPAENATEETITVE